MCGGRCGVGSPCSEVQLQAGAPSRGRKVLTSRAGVPFLQGFPTLGFATSSLLGVLTVELRPCWSSCREPPGSLVLHVGGWLTEVLWRGCWVVDFQTFSDALQNCFSWNLVLGGTRRCSFSKSFSPNRTTPCQGERVAPGLLSLIHTSDADE